MSAGAVVSSRVQGKISIAAVSQGPATRSPKRSWPSCTSHGRRSIHPRPIFRQEFIVYLPSRHRQPCASRWGRWAASCGESNTTSSPTRGESSRDISHVPDEITLYVTTLSFSDFAIWDKLMKDLSIIVVGAGIGGLQAALALSARGHRVTVLEAVNEFREVGAGIRVPPNSNLLSQSWGVDFSRIKKCKSLGKSFPRLEGQCLTGRTV
jgi:FAD binding domain